MPVKKPTPAWGTQVRLPYLHKLNINLAELTEHDLENLPLLELRTLRGLLFDAMNDKRPRLTVNHRLVSSRQSHADFMEALYQVRHEIELRLNDEIPL